MNTDVLILGAGPAGLQAAIHASRKKANVIVLGRPEKSAIREAWVENYCCTEASLHGQQMLVDGKAQAEKFGAVFIEEDAIDVKNNEGTFTVKLESGREIFSRAIILAIGVTRNKANIKGELEFSGRGVSYCVECDANFFKGKKVAVLGDGSAAASGSALLTKYAKTVKLISHGLNVAPALRDEAIGAGVELFEKTWISEIKGNDSGVTSVLFTDGTEENFDGIFIELGAKGAVELAVSLGVNLDTEKFKYIDADKKQSTNVAGIYAAGDICGAPFQLAKAVGEGCVAGTNAAEYVRTIRNNKAEVK